MGERRATKLLLYLIPFLQLYYMTESASVTFEPGKTYRYHYEGTATLGVSGTFRAKAEFSVTPLSPKAAQNRTQTCQLTIHYYRLAVHHAGQDYVPDGMQTLDFSKWMSFSVTDQGEIKNIYYKTGEHADVLSFKKMILGTLSSKLVISDQHLNANRRWGYEVQESAHEGQQTAVYHAEPQAGRIVFNKYRKSKVVHNADEGHRKTIHYNVGLAVPHLVSLREHFVAPHKSIANYKDNFMHGQKKMQPDATGHMDLSQMRASGEVEMKLLHVRDSDLAKTMRKPKHVTRDTLAVHDEAKPVLPLQRIRDEINGNMTCAEGNAMRKEKGLRRANRCFSMLCNLLRRLNKKDLTIITAEYLHPSINRRTKVIFVDALSTLATEESYTLLEKYVFLSKPPNSDLFKHALIHLGDQENPPPMHFLEILYNLAFDKPIQFSDPKHTKLIHNGAALALGSLANQMKKHDPAWSEKVVNRLHVRAGVHDQWQHRQRRSMSSHREFRDYVITKSTDILALGNAAVESSFPLLCSYLNNTDDHIGLRTSAVEALSRFEHQEAADQLLMVALTDTATNVRMKAIQKYNAHPLGGDVAAVLGLGEKSVNVSATEYKRVRRSVDDTVQRIFQGFEFVLETPSINWVMEIGDKAFGASFGIIVKNILDLNIAPLSGHFIVDVHDSGFATAHLGIIGLHIDLLRAEICFDGSIEYNFNILNEYNFDEIQYFADLYNTKVAGLIDLVSTTMEQFRELIETFKDFSPKEIVDGLIESVKDFPRKVFDLRTVAERLRKSVTNFVDLPPVVDEVKDFVDKAMPMFNDIKSDIMTLYHNISDAVTVTIPWALEETKASYDGITKVIPNMIENPKTAIQNIGREVARISTSFGVIIAAKNKIAEANIFDQDNRPHWSDLNTELEKITEEVAALKEKLTNTIKLLNTGDTSGDTAKRLTGIDLATMKEEALTEMKDILEEEILNVKETLNNLLGPFKESFDLFTGYVKNIKEAWRVVVEGFEEARTEIQMIFGPRIHKGFLRKYLESESCGDGFWQSNGKGHYIETGVDVEAVVGDEVPAPFNGKLLRLDGENRVAILARDMQDVEVIMENIEPFDSLIENEVGAGDAIGHITQPKHCDDGHIHFSLRKRGHSNSYIDPSRYMESRDFVFPEWIERCDHYILKWKGDTKFHGAVTGDPIGEEHTPGLPDAPDMNALQFEPLSTGNQNTSRFQTWVDDLDDFVKALGLPDFGKIEDILTFDMNTLPVHTILNYADNKGYKKAASSIRNILLKIQEISFEEECMIPERMEELELKSTLHLRGKPTEGSRTTLEHQFEENAQRCFGISSKLGENVFCHMDNNCLSMTCCVEMTLFVVRFTATVALSVDVQERTLHLGIDRWKTRIPFGTDIKGKWGIDGSFPTLKDFSIMNAMQLVAHYKIDMEKNILKVTFAVSWCSTKTEECLELIDIFREVEIEIPKFDIDLSFPKPLLKPDITLPSFEDLLNINIGELINLADVLRLDDSVLLQMIQDLRDNFHQWLSDAIKEIDIQIFPNEFERWDMCMEGYELDFGETKVEILYVQFTIPIVYFSLQFRMGLDGYFGGSFNANLCLLTMSGDARVTPYVGMIAWANAGLKITIFSGQIHMEGQFLTTEFPTKAAVKFTRIPLHLTMSMDVEMTPVALSMHCRLVMVLRKKERVLIDWVIWRYTTSPIKKNMLHWEFKEKDETPPEFSEYEECGDEECETRKRRSITRYSESTGECQVEQIIGRDYTEPAVNIEFVVTDDESEVYITADAGTFDGGDDVIKEEPLEGYSSILILHMVDNKPVYFTVTATNSDGLSSKATCHIETLDTTLPTGRIYPEFNLTSHPHIIRASMYPWDDSPITTKKASLGFGKGLYGTQVVNWHDAETASVQLQSGTGQQSDIMQEHFTGPREGRLSTTTIVRGQYTDVEECAQVCLSSSECHSFCFDFGDNGGDCELFESVQGNGIELHKSQNYLYFEKLGIPGVLHLRYDDLDLSHGTMVYVNGYLQNSLLYENIISSHGIMVDLTPPLPSQLKNITQDDFVHEDCEEFLPADLTSRCIMPTPAPNHRIIAEGEGSSTIFNGYEALIPGHYTRANRMISANWDSIHDDESGVLMFSWAVGTEICSDDIRPHTDPHEGLENDTDWRHVGVAFPMNLQDGSYYVTVKAINKVLFGGPMALTLCHSLPYILDTTPPILHDVFDTTYDEETSTIRTSVRSVDLESGIKKTELAIGISKRDTSILDWTEMETHHRIEYHFTLPGGKVSWIKLRVTNNVDLRAVGHAEESFLVDATPPIAGNVYDGDEIGISLEYQSSTATYCANWDGFNDPESGISKYIFGVGEERGQDDIVAFMEVPNTATLHCEDGLKMKHKTIYYGTIIAINGAETPLNVSVTSSGVYIDKTGPEKGWVKDGKNKNKDLEYSADAGEVSTHFEEFSDPESGLKKFDILVYRKHSGENEEESMVHKEADIDSTASLTELRHFNLDHGDYVRVEVNATNKAGMSISESSDGFLIDLTQPVVVSLVDGTDVEHDLEYTDSTTSLSCAWDMKDDESGIDHYEIMAYELTNGIKTKIYPVSSEWQVVPGKSSKFTTTEPLQLTVGHKYTMRVRAVNGVGITAIRDTNGVIVDQTPPEMVWIHVGVNVGESEELVDGYVIQTDLHGIKVEWYGFDAESDIQEYFIAVGTKSGRTDICDYRSMGKFSSAYINDLVLETTDLDKNRPIYYVSFKAFNKAGMESITLTSTPIRVVAGDKAGAVYIGPTAGQSIRYQSDRTTVTFNFRGFESEQHGIDNYEWSLGTAPGKDDVLPYSSYGLLVTEDNEPSVIGLGGSGKGQTMTAMTPGITYFVNVRATTGVGNVLESTSDSFVVDESEPVVTIVTVGTAAEALTADAAANGDVIYQTEHDWYTATWDIIETGNEVADTSYTIKNYPDSVIDGTPASGRGIAYGTEHLAADGNPNILTVKSSSMTELAGTVIAPAVVVDTSPPEAGVVMCPKSIQVTSDIRCTWQDFQDKESGIEFYLFGIGTTKGDDNVFPFTKQEQNKLEISALHIASSLNHGENYYATVVATNKVGLSVRAFSSPIIVDTTPPVGRMVIELSDTDNVIVGEDESNLVHQCDENEDICIAQDAVCQVSLTQVKVAWQRFHDPESEIIRYEVALGSRAGMSDIHQFKDIPTGKTTTVFNGLDLASTRQVFATVRGTNSVGLHATATSNGVFISRRSAGLESLGTSYVYDGDIQGKDLEYQNRNEHVAANWDFSGDPCPCAKYDWAVYRFDGTEVLPMETVVEGLTVAYAEETVLHDDESFYVVVRATNELGYTYSLHSDGVTIKLEPLLPGVVRDGDKPGVDLHTQPSVTSLSANWDGFGVDWYRENEGIEDIPGVDRTIGQHQTIHHYEVAAGTDRRDFEGRTNVHPFVNVGLSKTWTFSGLDLSPKTPVYFMTVRAYSVSGEKAEVTSNGVRAGIEDDVKFGALQITTGVISVPSFISSSTEVSVSWSDFSSTNIIDSYRWGIAQSNLDSKRCEDFNGGGNDGIFGIHPLTDVGLDTFVRAENLHMQHGTTYYVAVIADDDSGSCAMATEEFTVDTSDPEEGVIEVGPKFDGATLLYTPDADSVEVHWEDYEDPESDIDSFRIALYYTAECSPDEGEAEMLEDFVRIPGNVNTHTFVNLQLSDALIYFVHLETINGAGAKIMSISRPILTDTVQPTVGKIFDGLDFKHDVEWQSSESRMEGIFIYVPLYDPKYCPSRVHSLRKLKPEWNSIVHRGLYMASEEKQDGITFYSNQVSDGNMGTVIHMTQDTTEAQMLSGAVGTHADIQTGGTYQIDIKAASGDLKAVTSVVFWNGASGAFGDFPVHDFENDTNFIDIERHGIIITDDRLQDETPSGTPVFESGFGMQIHPNVTYEGVETHCVVLWTSTDPYETAISNSTVHAIEHLEFDPSEDWHKYTILINKDNKEEEWELELLVDGEVKLQLGGGKPMGRDSQVVFGVYNRLGYVPNLHNIFYPAETSAVFRNFGFPPDEDELCRYGDAFDGGEHPVVEFYAGVGTVPGTADFADYEQISGFCTPCNNRCPEQGCDSNCKLNDTQEITVTLDKLDLESVMPEKEQQIYYLTIKGITGSGREVIGSSTGIYVDITGPVFENFFYVNKEWDDFEQTEYQNDLTTIAVYWEVDDVESGVVRTRWAIGRQSGGTDLQGYTEVDTRETDGFAWNDQLAGRLHSGNNYYVSVKAENKAGVTSTKRAAGVTVEDKTLNMTGTVISVDDSSILGRQGAAASVYELNYQDKLYIRWVLSGAAEKDVAYVYLTIDTPGESDILAMNQVGNEDVSACIKIRSDEAEFCDDDDLSKANETMYYLEPGRTLQLDLMGCSEAHNCDNTPVYNIIIKREEDELEFPSGSSKLIDMTLECASDVSVQTQYEQVNGTVLIGGILSDEDLETYYVAAGAENFKPYIVSPQLTIEQTNRLLRHRIKSWQGCNFFMSTIPGGDIDGPINITTNYESTGSSNEPKLLMWCADTQMWVDAGSTCSDDIRNNYFIDNVANLLTVMVCSSVSICDKSSSLSQNNFAGSIAFSLATVGKDFVNHAPLITSPSAVHMLEDEGTLLLQLTAEDDDEDELTFEYVPQKHTMGNVVIYDNGTLLYTPCNNCNGPDTIHYNVVEDLPEDIRLQTSGELTVGIHPVNDVPQLYPLSGTSQKHYSGQIDTMLIEENSSHHPSRLEVLVLAYDVDKPPTKLQVLFDSPKYGDLRSTLQVNDVKLQSEDCGQQNIDSKYKQLIDDLRSGKMITSLPLPCETDVTLTSQLTNIINMLTYVPHHGFCGTDTLKIIALDDDGAYSSIYSVQVFVLCNPCIHGHCVGPRQDKDCTDPKRSKAFDGYRCVCDHGFTGDVCHVPNNKFDKHASQSSGKKTKQQNVNRKESIYAESKDQHEGADRNTDVENVEINSESANSNTETETAKFENWQLALLCTGVAVGIVGLAFIIAYSRKKAIKRTKSDRIPLVDMTTTLDDVPPVSVSTPTNGDISHI